MGRIGDLNSLCSSSYLICARHCANHSHMVWNPQHCCVRWGHVSWPWLAGSGAGSSCCLPWRLSEEKLGACSGSKQALPLTTALLFPLLHGLLLIFSSFFTLFLPSCLHLPLVSPCLLPLSCPCPLFLVCPTWPCWWCSANMFADSRLPVISSMSLEWLCEFEPLKSH